MGRVILLVVLLVSVLGVPLASAADQGAVPMAARSCDCALQEQRLLLERATAARTTNLEYAKIGATGLSILIPLFAALLVARAQARTSFELKAAELVLGSQNPFAARNRAEILKKLFPVRLPQDFAQAFRPEEHARVGPSTESKLELLKLIAAHPGREADVVTLWRRMYPKDTLERLFPGDYEGVSTEAVASDGPKKTRSR